MIVGKTHNIRVYSEGEYAVLEQVGNGKKVRVHASQIPKFVREIRATADGLLKKTNSGDSH